MTDTNEYKEALLYKKYSLFIAIVSIPFLLIGYILRDSSSFAIEVMSLGTVGLVVGIPCFLIFDKRSKNLKNQGE